MSISVLPLQDMIASVVKTASDKLAANRSTASKIKQAAASEYEYSEVEPQEPAVVGFTDRNFVMKLASACDFITDNVEKIAAPNRGVLGNAILKLAEGGISVPPTNPEGALETTTSPDGEQKYKKDKPAGEDAAASQADTSLSGSTDTDGDTQLDNTMHNAPGQASGSVPTATYPEDGPFHNGTKTAGIASLAAKAKAGLGRAGTLLAGGTKQPFAGAGKGGSSIGKVLDKRPGNSATALGQRTGAGSEARKSLAARGTAAVAIGGVGASMKGGKKKEKTAGELARELILQKLAGEDVTKSNISSSGDGGPLVGDGELDVLISGEDNPSNPTDSSAYGNAQRSLIQSNESAMNYTKGDAKKPQGKQMAEVIDEPAFSDAHDSKLREQLQNAGEAGVKIAGAAVVNFLKQAAAKGVLNQETVDRFKAKTKTASDHSATSGTTQGSSVSSDATVAKLRSMMDAQRKHKASMGDGEIC